MTGTLTKDVALNIIGQIADYQAAAAQIPGVTQKAAASAALKMQAVFVKQAKDQLTLTKDTADKVVKIQNDAANRVASGFGASFQKAAKSIQQNQLISQVETVGSLFIQLGGNVSRVASIFTSAVRPLAIMNAVLGEAGASIAIVGGAALAGTIVLGGLVYAFSSLGSSASDARIELEKFGIQVNAQQRDQLDAYTLGANNLTIASDKLKVSFGSELAEDIGAVKTGLSQFFDMINNGIEYLGQYDKAMQAVTTVFNPLKTVVDLMLGRFKDQNKALADAKQQSEEFDREMIEMGRATDAANKALEVNVKRVKEQAKVGQDATTQLKNEIEAQKELDAAVRAVETAMAKGQATIEKYYDFRMKVAMETVGAEDKIKIQTADRYAYVADLEAKGVIGATEASITRISIAKSEAEDLHEISQKRMDADQAAEIAFNARVAQRKQERVDYEKEAAYQIADAYVSAAQSVTDAWLAADQERIGDTESTISHLKSTESSLTAKIKQEEDYKKRMILINERDKVRMSEKSANAKLDIEKKMAKQSAIAARAVSVFAIGLSTAEAIAKAIAEWGPPPSPPGILGMAAAAAVGGAQLTAVLAQPLPTFYGGTARIPDGPGEVAATLHGGESVLNSRATRDLGPAIIDALNAGLSPLSAMQGGGDLIMDGERVGRVMARQARGPGQLGEVIRASTGPVGFQNPYGRY